MIDSQNSCTIVIVLTVSLDQTTFIIIHLLLLVAFEYLEPSSSIFRPRIQLLVLLHIVTLVAHTAALLGAQARWKATFR
jgi:hypothetical protein